MQTKWIIPAFAGLFVCAQVSDASQPAVDGNCIVCLYEMGELVPGKKEFSAIYDRQTYHFPGAKQLQMFRANPAKYVPALAGDCSVCFEKMGIRVPGKAQYWVKQKGRLYLFPSDKERQIFRLNPGAYANADVAYKCYCSVCLLKAEKLVAGKEAFVSVYDGLRYLFPGAGEKRTFDANPAQFAPALGGNCTVCLKNAGKNVRGSLKYGAYYNNRCYLFPEDKIRKVFMANSEKYADVDLANGGNCIVCAKLAGKSVPGSPKYISMYKGKIYRFPSDKERNIFDTDPANFVRSVPVAQTKVQPVPAPKSNPISVSGKTACAGCEFGKRPITDPQSLGLAVVTNKKVYIIEGAEKRYPMIFTNRFSELPVQVQGTVRRQEGRFVWLDPTSVRRLP